MKIGVLGGGAWGLTLSLLLFEKGHRIKVWEFDKEVAERIRKDRENVVSLPEIKIPEEIHITSELEELEDSDLIVSAIPSWTIRSALSLLEPKEGRLIVSCSKGIEEKTFFRPSEIIEDVLGSVRVVALSGPSHAEEVVRKVPSAVVVSGRREEDMEFVQTIFAAPHFRVYTNPDITGVELGGALKNIIAIATGISDGIGFGDNTRAALFCRGIAEIARFGRRCGAKEQTFFGLAGAGDLMVTITSRHSRNRRFGELIGSGESVESALSEIKVTVEGIKTTKACFMLAEKREIEMPITEQVYKILFERLSPRDAVKSLLQRELKREDERI
jgi:glycerol-3-phosphate dehydrogenase (NAD(P)+)